uniref:DUF148 domain-containing protein n=1 Tax=Strongyloides papillosus TaxID=174720 RepID=A0A0N5BJE2_STREA
MNYKNIFLLFFNKILNILSQNITTSSYTDNNSFISTTCYICDTQNESIVNDTYDVLGAFTNSLNENIINTTTIELFTSTSKLSSDFVTATNTISITQKVNATCGESFNPINSSVVDNRNTTPLILYPLTRTQPINPFLIKLGSITTLPLTSTSSITISNLTTPSLANTKTIRTDMIMNIPMYSFMEIDSLVSDIEANLTMNIINNINLTNIKESDELTASINTQIKQLFTDALSLVKNNMYLKNITFNTEK